MQTATVFTNLTCNQRCGFCTFRRPADEPGFADPARVRAEIEDAARGGARSLVLSGGEPTLSPSLLAHIRHARRLGVERVIVESNGLLLAYPGRARALAEAGCQRVRIGLFSADAGATDAVTETPGGFELTLRGLGRALEAGLELEVSVAVTSANLDGLGGLPGWLHERTPAARRPQLVGLLLRIVTDAEARWIPRYADAARAIERLTDEARALRLPVRFDGRHGVPLCFFEARRRYPELFAGDVPRQGHGFTRVQACEGCAALERCPGVPERYLAAHGATGARAVPARQARFVAGLGRDRADAVERELVNDAFFAQGPGGLERVLRINFHCNQACEFCFVDRTLPAVSEERIEAEIERARDDGVSLLSLSGGEPTLHPGLPRFVRAAKAAGLRTQIQTNAVRCGDGDLAATLAGAGLDQAFVSLHAGRAALSDEITSAPGTFAKTVRGIDALVGAGVAVTLNCVLTTANAPELPALARLVAARWGRRVRMNLSFVHASTDLVPLDAQMIPRLTEVCAEVDAAVAILEEAAVPWQGFDGQCGMPLCVVRPGWLDAAALHPLPAPNPPDGFVKVDACRRCALSDRCVGMRATYAALHGTGELRPVSDARPGSDNHPGRPASDEPPGV